MNAAPEFFECVSCGKNTSTAPGYACEMCASKEDTALSSDVESVLLDFKGARVLSDGTLILKIEEVESMPRPKVREEGNRNKRGENRSERLRMAATLIGKALTWRDTAEGAHLWRAIALMLVQKATELEALDE